MRGLFFFSETSLTEKVKKVSRKGKRNENWSLGWDV